MMMDRRANLSSFHEGMTRQELAEAVQEHGCEVHLKMRVADALNIDSSGLSDEHYRYALKAHFDFVVSEDGRALFAVEFDDPSHFNDSDAQRRDRLKNSICLDLGMPLLRIHRFALEDEPANFRIVEWLVDMWFQYQRITELQEEGVLPADELIDPRDAMNVEDGKLKFTDDPLPALTSQFRDLADRKVSWTGYPLHVRWRAEQPEAAKALVMAEVHPDTGSRGFLYGYARCSCYRFGPVLDTDLAEILAYDRALRRFEAFAAGEQSPAPLRAVGEVLERCGVEGVEFEYVGPDDYQLGFFQEGLQTGSFGGTLRCPID